MVALDNLNNKEILKDSITYLEKSGYKNIKAQVVGYDSPKSYHKVGSDVSMSPDIEAEHNGKTHYFEISLKSEQPQLLKNKLKFLATITKMKDYRLKVITKRGHFKYTQDLLADLHLDRHPIQL
jgi:hypothetical protein